MDLYTQGEYIKGYYHDQRPRKNFAVKEWDDKSKDWCQLSINEKIEAGKRRATGHSRHIRRKNSFLENVKLFQDFSRFCDSENINLLFVVTPVTPYYLNYLLPDHKSIFYDVLNKASSVIHVLDLADDPAFSDEDFNDADHLNEKGAEKLTYGILDILQEIT